MNSLLFFSHNCYVRLCNVRFINSADAFIQTDLQMRNTTKKCTASLGYRIKSLLLYKGPELTWKLRASREIKGRTYDPLKQQKENSTVK